jgi:hypothetical protein
MNMKRILIAAAFLFAQVHLANAQSVRATETWYGLYTVEDVRTIEDPNAPGGQRRVGGRIMQPKQNSERIPHTPRSYFGFGYVLSGSDATITVRHLQLIPPPGILDSTGKRYDSLDRTLNLSAGRDLFVGLSMGENTPLGIWTFQVWHEGRVLLERKFELYRP